MPPRTEHQWTVTLTEKERDYLIRLCAYEGTKDHWPRSDRELAVGILHKVSAAPDDRA